MKNEKFIKISIIYGWIYLLINLCLFSGGVFLKNSSTPNIISDLIIYVIYIISMCLIQKDYKDNFTFFKKNKFLKYVIGLFLFALNILTGIALFRVTSNKKEKELPVLVDEKKNETKEVISNFIVFILFILVTFFVPEWLSNKYQYYLLLITTFIFCVKFYFKEIVRDFKALAKNFGTYVLLSAKTYIKAMAVSFVVVIFILLVYQGGTSENQELINEAFKISPVYIALLSVIYAPVVEELICRKCLKKIFKQEKLYLFMSALIFGILHVIDEFIANPSDILQLLYALQYGTLGYFFAKVYYKTNNIFSSIMIHMFQNTFAILMMLITTFIL